MWAATGSMITHTAFVSRIRSSSAPVSRGSTGDQKCTNLSFAPTLINLGTTTFGIPSSMLEKITLWPFLLRSAANHAANRDLPMSGFPATRVSIPLGIRFSHSHSTGSGDMESARMTASVTLTSLEDHQAGCPVPGDSIAHRVYTVHCDLSCETL